MWSVACIVAELYFGEPIFCGEDNFDQFACIAEYLGHCPKQMAFDADNKDLFDENNEICGRISPTGIRRGVGSKWFASRISARDLDFSSFLCDCLKWIPEERPEPARALQHSWLSK